MGKRLQEHQGEAAARVREARKRKAGGDLLGWVGGGGAIPPFDMTTDTTDMTTDITDMTTHITDMTSDTTDRTIDTTDMTTDSTAMTAATTDLTSATTAMPTDHCVQEGC